MVFAVTSDPWENSLYVLAEQLHMPVYQIRKEMPLSELIGWTRYYENKNKPPPIEIDQMTPDQLRELFPQ